MMQSLLRNRSAFIGPGRQVSLRIWGKVICFHSVGWLLQDSFEEDVVCLHGSLGWRASSPGPQLPRGVACFLSQLFPGSAGVCLDWSRREELVSFLQRVGSSLLWMHVSCDQTFQLYQQSIPDSAPTMHTPACIKLSQIGFISCLSLSIGTITREAAQQCHRRSLCAGSCTTGWPPTVLRLQS